MIPIVKCIRKPCFDIVFFFYMYNSLPLWRIMVKFKEGYLYHIKDEFFDFINDNRLMKNHENGHTRPTYFAFKEGDIFWFIPISSKVDKYQNIINKKIEKYGSCKTIMIRKILNKKSVILLQNAFPVLENYIDHIHIKNGVHTKVADALKKDIIENFNYMLYLKRKGNNLFFTDIDKIKKILLDEYKK